MEPLDPAKNDEGNGFYKKRISSILKAPHKSSRFSESEQQEHTVECAKLVEKRISRRVSFAPANDVLLFSKDVKSSSPVRVPLQELPVPSAATSQNGVQMMVTEDGIQQITGMETLLNAPLHALQQKDTANVNTGHHFGEKTLMFNTDDAFMDMTSSHTINIANDLVFHEDTLHEQDDVLPTSGEKTLMFPEAEGPVEKNINHTWNMICSTGRNIDLRAEQKNRPSAVPELDLGFKNFLASLSKQSAPSVNPVITSISSVSGTSSGKTGATNTSLAHLKTQSAEVHKENQPSALLLTARDKSLNTTKRFGESLNRSVFGPDNNMSMDITETHTGHIMGFSNEDHPIQCLFPTQETYADTEKRRSHAADTRKTPQQESPKTLASSIVRAPATTEKRVKKVIADDQSRQIADEKSLIHPSLHTSHQRLQVNLKAEDGGPEKTIVFSTDDAFMDMTQSQTVNIASVPLAPSNQLADVLLTCGKKDNASSLEQRKSMAGGTSANHLDPGFENLCTRLSTQGGPIGHPLITTKFPTAGSPVEMYGKVDTALSRLKSSDATICFEDDVSMDMTEAQTGHIMGCTVTGDPFQSLLPTRDVHETQQKNSDTLESSKLQDLETSFKASLNTKAQNHQVKFDAEEDFRDRTVRFTAEDACMDVTQSCTVNIATDFEPQAQERFILLPTFGEKTIRFNANDANMDVTRSHTAKIDIDLPLYSHQDLDFTPACGDQTVKFSVDEAAMDMTQCLTVNIGDNVGMSSSSSNTAVNTHSSLIHNQAPTGMSVSGRRALETSNQVVVDPDDGDDVSMDITEVQTGHITGVTGSDDALQWKEETVALQQTAGLGLNSKAMQSTLRAPLQTKMQRHQVKCDAVEDLRERTVRFNFEEACMDVTRSHTVNIATGCELQSKHNVDALSSFEDKTLKFGADDACMDVTKSHTVNIVTDFEPQSQENLNPLNRFSEKTVECHVNGASMDLKHSHAVNIATDIKPKSLGKSDVLPRSEEQTVRFSTSDAAMDMTQSLTVNIGLASDIPQEDSDFSPSTGNMDSAQKNTQPVTSVVQRSRPSLAPSLDPAFKTTPSQTSGLRVNPVVQAADTPSSDADAEGSLGHSQMQKAHVDTGNKICGLVPDVSEKPVNEMMKNDNTLNRSVDFKEGDASMDMTEAQTGHILGHTFTEDPSQCPPVKELNPNADDAASQDHSLASRTNHVEVNNLPNTLDSDETRKDHEERNRAGALPKPSNSPADEDIEEPSRKSRRMALADFLPMVRRMSQMINAAPDNMAMESSVPHEENVHENSDKTKPLSEAEQIDSENMTQAPPTVVKEEPPSVSSSATPFNLKTNQLMSRLSMSGFKPKLPRKSRPDPKKADSSHSEGERRRTITVNVPHHLNSFDHDVSDICGEELGSYEDTSETLDMRSPLKDSEKPQEFSGDVEFVNGVCEEGLLSTAFGKKRPVLEDDSDTAGEKRLKQSDDVAEMGIVSDAVECDSNTTAAASILPNDSSTGSHTASIACTSTSESTWKQSLFESQLEDYATDMKMKFDDGSLTVSEFFKLFSINFVIHNPRQSVLPGRLCSDTDRTPMDSLKDRHISRPQQRVYEANVQSLAEQVERLKVRMRDLDKPLKMVNRPLWEEMANFTEAEFKAFGAKLKERNYHFRKMSKVQSHEMKEVLYSSLVQVNLEEQKKLKAKIEVTGEVIKSLDDCIEKLQTDLASVEDEVKSHQEALKTLADKDRKVSELEMQNKQNLNKVNRLKKEAKEFESHISVLHMINEWKLREKTDNRDVYTFLHETLLLELVYEKSTGNDAENESARKIANISFNHQLDDEKSQFDACFVHHLVSQYTAGETDWVNKYPTRKHVPQLLHDVSLVVSRCRMLGEELHRLKMWGSLSFDILDLSCTDTDVHVLFSSLKASSKFEVVFSVGLMDRVCVLRLQSFRNAIGTTTREQIQEIVASVPPANNVLTTIVKHIHSSLLC